MVVSNMIFTAVNKIGGKLQAFNLSDRQSGKVERLLFQNPNAIFTLGRLISNERLEVIAQTNPNVGTDLIGMMAENVPYLAFESDNRVGALTLAEFDKLAADENAAVEPIIAQISQ